MGKLPIVSYNRRQFIKLNIAFLTAFLSSNCAGNKRNIKTILNDPFSKRGHQLRSASRSEKPKITIEKDIVIIGAGVSGLSAAYQLNKKGISDFVIYELSEHIGGNSHSGKNQYSEFPFGAHYLTIPNNYNTELINFLLDKNIITSIDEFGKPVYNEADLCFDPEERLLIRGGYQEGLIPNFGLNEIEKGEILQFFTLIDDFKKMKGSDGKFYFDTPYSFCSQDAKLDYLDKISFSDFLRQNNLKSEYLNWYLDYCCRDDFGGNTNQVSAWSGINYFACHRAEPSNTDSSRVLTWPEGNGKLIKLLSENLKEEQIRTSHLVKEINLIDDKVEIVVYDCVKEQSFKVKAGKCIIAIPPFVAQKILNKELQYPFDKVHSLKHAPWMVAAITLNEIPESRGMPLCWDNVAYKQKSLGYIYDQHQTLNAKEQKKVISLYFTFNEEDDRTARKTISEYQLSDWQKLVVSELEQMHTGISDLIEEIEVFIWGHGMILPKKGLIKSGMLKELGEDIENRIFFAHSDLSGYSTFEEAFDQGCTAFKKLIEGEK